MKAKQLTYRAWTAAILLLLAVLLPHHHHAVGAACYAIERYADDNGDRGCHPGHDGDRPLDRRNDCHLQMVGTPQAKVQRADAHVPQPYLPLAMAESGQLELPVPLTSQLSGMRLPPRPAPLPLSVSGGPHGRRGPPAVYEL